MTRSNLKGKGEHSETRNCRGNITLRTISHARTMVNYRLFKPALEQVCLTHRFETEEDDNVDEGQT